MRCRRSQMIWSNMHSIWYVYNFFLLLSKWLLGVLKSISPAGIKIAVNQETFERLNRLWLSTCWKGIYEFGSTFLALVRIWCGFLCHCECKISNTTANAYQNLRIKNQQQHAARGKVQIWISSNSGDFLWIFPNFRQNSKLFWMLSNLFNSIRYKFLRIRLISYRNFANWYEIGWFIAILFKNCMKKVQIKIYVFPLDVVSCPI